MSVGESDLALVTTDALLEELEKRFNHMAFIGRVDDALGPDRHRRLWRWAGDGMASLGLLVYLKYRIMQNVCERTGPDPCEPDEEEA